MKIQFLPLALASLFLLVQCSPENPATSALPQPNLPTGSDTQQAKPDLVQPDSLPLLSDSSPTRENRPAFKPAEIRFDTMQHDFGRIAQGSSPEFAFQFSNVGDRPLEISKVEGSCGCTVGSYPFLPISKSERGQILARFDSKGKSQKQETYLMIYSNSINSPHKLVLKSFVVKDSL